MTCSNCVEKVRNALTSSSMIDNVEVQLQFPQARISADEKPDIEFLQERIKPYKITEAADLNTEDTSVPEVSFSTYKPLILVISFILGICIAVQYPFNDFSYSELMQNFMAGFFLAFAFFKLLDLQAFAQSFAMYDILASRWHAYGFIYPFLELALGILYLIGISQAWLHIAVIVILGLGTLGVIRSNLQKRKIKCACLGTVFNLPMSQVTIIENLSMIAMALIMWLA